MDGSSKSKRVETREFWEAAIRLWAESALSVREFCSREGLTEHTFYSWRRELMPENSAVGVKQEPAATDDAVVATNGRRRRRWRKPVVTSPSENASSVEFLPVRVVGGDASCTPSATAVVAQGTSPIEIVGASSWRVRILSGFDPATLDAVLTTLERRPC